MSDDEERMTPRSSLIEPRLLVVRLSALGDVIHTIPAVMMLRSSWDVSWVVEKSYAELVEIVAGVRAIPVQLRRWSLPRILQAWRSVRGFEVAVDFQGLIKSALLSRASGAPARYGFAPDSVRERPAARFYTDRVSVDPTQHVVDWNRQLAAGVTLRSSLRSVPQPHWSAFASDEHGRLSALTGRVVLLPGAGRPEKQWPVSRFRELVAHYGEAAVVVAGPGERRIAEQIGGSIAPDTTLRELAFILLKARVAVGGDTGPLHLADALGTPVVGLYGPTRAGRNGPYLQRHGVIQAGAMQEIAAADVMRKIAEVIRE